MAATVRRVSVITVLAIGLTLALACSSVPDITFVDGGDGTSSSSSGDSGTEGGPSLPDWSCPNKPPPANSGSVCCGNRLCIKCTASDCAKCEQEGCGGTLNAACCRKNPVQLQCKAYPDC